MAGMRSMRAWCAAPRGPNTALWCYLDVEAEVHHVAVLHDVVLALEAHLARFLRLHLAAEPHVVVVRDDFGTNEALLEVGVDDARGLRRGRALAHGPRAHFLRARREVGLQAEQRERRADEAIEPRLL